MVNADRLLRGFAYVTVEATDTPVAEMLRRRAHQPYPIALGKVASGKLLQPLVPASMHANGRSYELMSRGSQQLVYSNGSEVMKLIASSLSTSQDRADAAAETYQRSYDQVSSFMGEHLVPTEYDVRKLRAGIYSAIAMQPHLRPEKSFKDIAELVDYRDDEDYLAELRDFYEALWALYRHTGVQVDLNGEGNVVLADNGERSSMTIVDTIFVAPEMQHLKDHRYGFVLGETIMSKMARICEVAFTPVPIELSESAEIALR